jgi:hypothetical protein
LSWEILFNKETNYTDNVSESRHYSGFGYIIRAGIQYNIGSRSDLVVQLIYNGCTVTGNEEQKHGLPTWDEVNVSGLGITGGLRLLL